MSLSERLNRGPLAQRPERLAVYEDVTGSSPVRTAKLPEWRRRQLERLEKNGRVAEKALDR